MWSARGGGEMTPAGEIKERRLEQEEVDPLRKKRSGRKEKNWKKKARKKSKDTARNVLQHSEEEF